MSDAGFQSLFGGNFTMNVFYNAVNVISIILEILITADYFKTVSKRKDILPEKFFAVCCVLTAVNAAAMFLINIQAVTTIVMMTSIFVISFLYKLSTLKRVIFSAILIVLLILSEMLIGMLLTVISDSTVEELRSNLFFYIQGVLISKLFMFVIIKLFGYFSIRSETRISAWLFIPLFTMPIATFLVAFVMSEYMYRTKDLSLMRIAAVSVIALTVSNVLLFYLFELQLRESENRSKAMLLQQQIQNKSDYYKELAEKQRISNKVVHDLKNKLFALEELMKNDPAAGAEEIKKITDQLLSVSAMTFTGIDSIDALITVKKLKMQENDIRFTHRLCIPKETLLQPLDFCVVLGNLLDNAIEANEKLPKNDRFISLSAAQKQGYLSVQISNPIRERVRIKNNEIFTTKRDKQIHGFGLQSVKEIVEKHDGTISFEQEENVFTVIVMLRNN